MIRMNKIKIAFLILALAMILSSCVTKKDIMKLENDLENLEDEFEQLDETKDELDKENEALSAEAAELSKVNSELLLLIAETETENIELANSIINPPIPYNVGGYLTIFREVVDNEGILGDYFEVMEDYEPSEEDTEIDNKYIERVYVFEGDENTDNYVKMTILAEIYEYTIYSITIEYSSEENSSKFSDLELVSVAALYSMLDDPYNYEDNILESAQVILEQGDYYNGLIIIEQTETANGKTTKMYVSN